MGRTSAMRTSIGGRNRVFRFHSKTLFATWPKCSIPEDVVLSNIKERWGDTIEWAVVAQEKHKDGDKHIHAVIKWINRLDIRTFKSFDDICGQHGNYQPCRNIRNSVIYVTKCDKFVWTGRDPATIIAKKKPLNAEIAERIIKGEGCAKLCFEYPGYMSLHYKQLHLFESVVIAEKLRTEVIKFTEVECNNTLILEWIQSAIYKERGFRAPQIYIWGKPGIGKSRVAQKLGEHCHTYHVGYEGWWCSYKDTEDLVIFDEFSGQYTPMFMNTFLDGNIHELKRKGMQRMLKKNKVPCMILANSPPDIVYDGQYPPAVINAFCDRLLIIEVTSEIDIYFTL